MKVQELFEDLMGQKQKRAEFLLKTYEQKWKKLPGFDDLKGFIEHVGEKIDPSQNGMYMQWIVKHAIANPAENKTEDLEKVAADLRAFEENKARIENKDINTYKGFHQLFDVIEPFTKPRELTPDEKKKAKEDAELAKVKGDIKDVYSGPEGWVKIPTTAAAAKFIGQSTRWCTTNASTFQHYNKSDALFVIYDKAKKTRHQLHIQSGQFCDEADRGKGMNAVPEWARKPIIEWYKKNNPKLSMKHLMTFAGYGDTSAAKGTPHEEVLELMKKYKIT